MVNAVDQFFRAMNVARQLSGQGARIHKLELSRRAPVLHVDRPCGEALCIVREPHRLVMGTAIDGVQIRWAAPRVPQ